MPLIHAFPGGSVSAPPRSFLSPTKAPQGRPAGSARASPKMRRVRIESEALMTNEAVGDSPADGGSAQGALGALATWRQTPRQVKAVLACVLVSKLAAFLQLFLLLFLKHRGFSSGEAGLALGVWGAGVVAGAATGGWLCDRINARATIMISSIGAAGLTISLVYIRVYLLLLLAVLLASTAGQLYRPAGAGPDDRADPPGAAGHGDGDVLAVLQHGHRGGAAGRHRPRGGVLLPALLDRRAGAPGRRPDRGACAAPRGQGRGQAGPARAGRSRRRPRQSKHAAGTWRC